MKKIALTLLILLQAGVMAHAQEWKLVWADEFTSEGSPDPTKWGYEEGFLRNEEKQYYTRNRRENARVENGNLVIEGRKESFKNERYDPTSKEWQKKQEFAQYTSASLTTLHQENWKYGRIEARAKLPHGRGVWPAIWTLGVNHLAADGGWPLCGEIDIMEYIGNEPNFIYGTVHYLDSATKKHKSSGNKWTTEKPFADFHIYAVEWTPQKIDFYFDDHLYHTFEVGQAGTGEGNPFRKPHYLLINLALGGNWGGKIDDAIFPQKYLIDYVRVYSK